MRTHYDGCWRTHHECAIDLIERTRRQAEDATEYTLAVENRELRAEVERLKREHWQPIETAPRDGTDVLIHGAIEPGSPGGHSQSCWAGNTAVAGWWGSEEGDWVCYMDLPDDPRPPFDPTHWRPLPPPPPQEEK